MIPSGRGLALPEDPAPRRSDAGLSATSFSAHTRSVGRGAGPWEVAEPAEVALALRQADAVEVLADGDGVFPGGAEQVAEVGHGHGGAVGEPVADAAPEFGL